MLSLDVRMILWFGGTWFGCRALDAWWPPENPTFNAALALMVAMACLARAIDKEVR